LAGDADIRSRRRAEERDLERCMSAWPDANYLLQQKITPRSIGGEPAYFRMFSVFGSIWCCWWNCFTDRYRAVTAAEEADLALAPLREIAGRPARDVFEEHIRRGNRDELDLVRPGGYYSTHAFGLIEPDGSLLIRGVFMDDGLIHTFAPLPVYSAIQIVSCDENDLLAVSHQVAEDSVAGRDASLLLVFSCIARLDALHERGGEEATRLQVAAGTVPVFGVYTYGEFARTTSVAGYHNSTVAAVAL
jgi:hypothetical protein